MNMKDIMDRVLFTLSVPKCVACRARLDYGEKGFCSKCSAKFIELKSRNCSFCARPLNRCGCTTEFLRAHYIKRTVKCFRYNGSEESAVGKALIFSLKRDNRADVLEVCTEELRNAISASVIRPEECIFTNVPRRRSAVVEYGIDQSAMLAKSLADRFGAVYKPLLGSNAKREQKALERSDRLKNADFYIKRAPDLTGNRVIIVDDIITSGASMASAAALIRSLGCSDITAAALAIAYTDNN